jgi:FAD/FMN-containing dehydrogenase
MSNAIFELVSELGGSISAEHGIGQMKRDALRLHKTPVELDMMRAVKHALDPKGILNPGKLL